MKSIKMPNSIYSILIFKGMTCFAWNNANENISSLGRRQMEIAGTIGVMSIITGILYMADFFYVMYQNALLAPQQ